MDHANRFEELIVWQRARELAKLVFEVTKKEGFKNDFKFVAQLRDASRSTAANIAEGFERRSRNEFHQGVVTAKGSAGEVRSDIYLAVDRGYISSKEAEHLISLSCEVSRLLESLRDSLDEQRKNK